MAYDDFYKEIHLKASEWKGELFVEDRRGVPIHRNFVKVWWRVEYGVVARQV